MQGHNKYELILPIQITYSNKPSRRNCSGKIIKGNIYDRSVLDEITSHFKDNIYADKVYIVSKALFEKLYQRGLKLMNGIKRNVRNFLIELYDKFWLRKRYKVETTFLSLKR